MVNTQKRMRGMQVIAIMLAVVLAFAGMIFAVMSSNGASAQAEQATPGSIAVGDSWLFGDEVVVDDDFYVASCLSDSITVYSFDAEFLLMQEQDVDGVWKIAAGLEYFGIPATSAEEPIGVRVASGAGTEENPFVMEAVYAEPATPVLPIVAVVQGTIGGTDAQYPNLISGSAHQVVVRYYLAMPEGYSEAGAGQFSAYVLPKAECTMAVSGNDLPAYAPASIAANAAFTTVGVNVADYNNEESELIEVLGTFAFADVVGATSSNNAWTVTNASNYLFEATYVIPADAPSGTYDFSFGLDEGESVSFGLPDETPVELAPVEKSGVSFNVYNTVALPETNDFVYDGASHLGGLEETADYTVTGTAQTNAGEDYTAVVSLKNFAIWDLGNGSYSTEDQTLYWDITARPVTLSFSAGAYSSTYGEYDDEEIAEAVGAIANAGTVVAADGILQADLASFAIGWDVTAGEYNSESFDVTHAGTGAAYLETANTGVYTLSIGYTANANYDVTVAGTATYTITVATPILEITEPDEDGTELRKYTGAAVTIGTSAAEILYEYVSDAGVVVTITWFDNEDNVIEAPVVVGNYKVRVALGATRNYTAASEERTFSIGKQNQTVTLTPHNRVFNGLAATIGVGDSYDIEVATNATSGASASYSHNGAILHANTYQDIAVTIPGDANYNEWNGTTSLVISPIAANFSITLQNETYKGTAYAGSELTVTSVSFAQNADLTAYLANVESDYDAFNAVSNFGFSLTPDGVLAAGTHTDAVAVSISGIYNFANAIYGDFTFTGADATVTIDKANLTIDIYNIPNDGDVAKQYDAEAVTDGYNDADNSDIAYYAYITGSSWGVEASRFDAPTDSFTVKYYNDEAGAPAGEIDAPSLPGTYWIVVTLDNATANFNANTVGAARQFVIEPSTVYVKLSYVYGANVKYLEYVNNALTYVNEETTSVMQAGNPMPVAATLNFFRTTGFGYDVVPFVAGNSQENPIEITATYTFDVGAGDLNGDKRVTSDDAITLRRILARHISVKNVAIRTDVNAWTDLATLDAEDLAAVGTIIFKKGADVIADEKINAVDVAATLEAFATGYGYAIVSDTDISGKKIKAIEEQTVYTYEELVSYVEMGYPVKLGADISAATRDFNPTFSGSVSIKMNGKRLTVNSFTLSTNEADVTLKVFNAAEAPGIIYSVDDIRISAPNGNVKVADVNGYTYEGNEVTLEAYTSSLHIEEDVAFYVYRVEGYGDNAAAFAASITTDEAVDTIADQNIENTNQLIADKVTKEGEKAALEAEKQALIDEGADEEEINAKVDEINAKGAEITNLEVKKAPVSIPVDTHVVVEEGASLKVEQINVVAANDATVSTFSIEVKNTEAEVVKVDISAVKSTEEVNQVTVNYYHVDEVALAGDTSKIEVVTAEDQTVSEITGVKNETELKAALAARSAVIEIGADFAVTHAVTGTYVLRIDYPVTINGNGRTINVTGNGVWIGANPTTVSAVNINDLTIRNASNAGRCVSTRAGIGELNLTNVNLICAGSGNNQVITVGGDHRPYIGTEYEFVDINIAHCNFDAGAAGYGVILFNKANVHITDSMATGWAVIYAKAPWDSTGARGSNILIEDSVLTSDNVHSGQTNAFSMLVSQVSLPTSNTNILPYKNINPGVYDYTKTEGVHFTVVNSTLNSKTTGDQVQYIVDGCFNDLYIFENCTFNLLPDAKYYAENTTYSEDSKVVETIDEENNIRRYYYQLDSAFVKNETELRNALALGASKITLGANITLSTSTAAERIAIDHPVELDMNGKTITSSEYAFVVMPGGELDIIGTGTFNYVGENHTMGALRVAGSDDVNAAEGKLTLGENVTIESNGYGIVIWHVNYRSYGSNVIVNGTINAYNAGICPSGNIKAAAGDVVNGAPIDAVAKVTIGSTANLYTEHEAAIYAAGFANIIVEDGAVITGDVSGVEVRGGFFTMNGGTITSNANATYTKANGNGTTGYGVGLIVAQHTTKQAVNATINGGTIIGPVALMQCNPENNSAADIAKITITINGGTFISSLGSVDILPVLNGATEAEAGTIVIVDEDKITYTVDEDEVTEATGIATFSALAAAIDAVNAGTLVDPVLCIVADIAFERELEIQKSVTILGDGEVKFIGYDASTKYDEAFYINVADEDQEITIDGIVFDHFCYYSNVANKTKATSSAVKNGVAYITYGGDCPASTTLYVKGCQFIGTARDMINASSTKGCKGFIIIEDCYFDATDRLSSTLNMLSFYGNEDGELTVEISGCTFTTATEQNATWATSAIASFGNTDMYIDDCDFISCQIGIAIDNTFDRLYGSSTYPVTVNTTVTLGDVTYTNCQYGYYGEFFVEDVEEIPAEAELYTDTPFTYGDYAATKFSFSAEYDVYVPGDGDGVQYDTLLCYYVLA